MKFSDNLLQAIAALPVPCTLWNLGDIKTKIIPNETRVHIQIPLFLPEAFIEPALNRLFEQYGLSRDAYTLEHQVIAHRVQNGVQTLPNIKNTIAVASGKGGVGKSTLTASLAVSLAKMGAKVGVLDADLYGPSQHAIFNIQRKAEQKEGLFLPANCNGIEVMSIGMMIDDIRSALVWRGPLITRALQQMFFQTRWNNLDYLLIDLPPGTGDIQLTLTQKIPLTGAVIVTTPQEMALLDARKAVDMFKKTSITLFGVIENMATFCCPHCGHREAIFGSDGGKSLAEEFDLPLLGQLPLKRTFQQAADSGHATDLSSDLINQIALNIAAQVARLNKDFSSIIPPVISA